MDFKATTGCKSTISMLNVDPQWCTTVQDCKIWKSANAYSIIAHRKAKILNCKIHVYGNSYLEFNNVKNNLRDFVFCLQHCLDNTECIFPLTVHHFLL